MQEKKPEVKSLDLNPKNAEILEKIETEDVEMVAPVQKTKQKRDEIGDAMEKLGFEFMPMTVLVEKARPNSKRHYIVAGYDANFGRRRYILQRTNGWADGQKTVKLDMRKVELSMRPKGEDPGAKERYERIKARMASMKEAYRKRREYTRPVTKADVEGSGPDGQEEEVQV